MAELPSGIVTFLFTDIEGSTRLWEQHPAAMRRALARHDRLLRAAIETTRGHVFKTIGDQFCAAFATALDAVAAALAAQRALQAEPWSEVGPLSVRMALHSGAVEHRDGDYFGPPLNRVARLLDAGHGGQILLSRATADLVRDTLTAPAALRDWAHTASRTSSSRNRSSSYLIPNSRPTSCPCALWRRLPITCRGN